ncbi:hypothetical protein SKAU_G00154650 [Synaphobranchus kaupii]|uniref:Uncharacterized protein n=1 Tax=Synaphobranchus kaupii TaxID=118154 RepID=A0A9Q1FHW0_SYNKA|nr:hypothetical protein SKAU_G00154650 [Synaphobranchus kaupii]
MPTAQVIPGGPSSTSVCPGVGGAGPPYLTQETAGASTARRIRGTPPPAALAHCSINPKHVSHSSRAAQFDAESLEPGDAGWIKARTPAILHSLFLTLPRWGQAFHSLYFLLPRSLTLSAEVKGPRDSSLDSPKANPLALQISALQSKRLLHPQSPKKGGVRPLETSASYFVPLTPYATATAFFPSLRGNGLLPPRDQVHSGSFHPSHPKRPASPSRRVKPFARGVTGRADRWPTKTRR